MPDASATPAPQSTVEDRLARLPVVAGPLAAVAAAVLAYAGSLQGDYVFDDLTIFVAGSPMARGAWWEVAFGHEHTPLANRPFACFTFAINPVFGASLPTAFRIGSLVLHVANVLLLFAVVRRCLLAPNLAGRFTERRAASLATAIAALWAAHPLGTDAVAYITQRSALLMATCFLGALYCVLRHASAPGQGRWRILAVVAMALGMASKEELVAGPLLVIAFERAFLLPDWRSLRAHRRFHLALASTWVVLAACVVLGPGNASVGYHTLVPVGPFEWLMTQAGVILHYIRLALLPTDLRGAYDWGIQRSFLAGLPWLAAVAVLFFAGLWQWRTRPWLGWLWTMFFLLLGPTSSVMPIVTEVVAERRAYLPMLAVLVPAVLLGAAAIARGSRALRLPVRGTRAAGWIVGTGVVVAAIAATRANARAYQDSETFWAEAYARNELENRSLVASVILCARGHGLCDGKRYEEGLALLERAMQCEAKLERVPLSYAHILHDRGRSEEAAAVLRELLQQNPVVGPAHGLLAFVLVALHERDLATGSAGAADPRLVEAVAAAKRAFELDASGAGPVTASYLNTLAMAYMHQGKPNEAESVLRSALHRDPAHGDAKRSLGAVLCFMGRPGEGIPLWQQVLAERPDDSDLRLKLAQAHLVAGDRAAAAREVAEVLRRRPDDAEALRLAAAIEAGPR